MLFEMTFWEFLFEYFKILIYLITSLLLTSCKNRKCEFTFVYGFELCFRLLDWSGGCWASFYYQYYLNNDQIPVLSNCINNDWLVVTCGCDVDTSLFLIIVRYSFYCSGKFLELFFNYEAAFALPF